MENVHDGLKGVERTLLLPLWGRWVECRKENGLIRDPACLEIVEKLGADFSGFEREQSPASRLAWAARAWNVDAELRKLLPAEGRATVVCLGCGLDTALFRTDNGRLDWYDLDLPEVISIRERVAPRHPRCRMIAGSILDRRSYADIRVSGRLIVIAVGVLYYFSVEQVRAIFQLISELAPAADLIIEYFSKRGVEIANRRVIAACSGARADWHVRGGRELAGLHPAVSAVETYPVFKKIRPLLDKGQRRIAFVADLLKIMSFAVIRLGA